MSDKLPIPKDFYTAVPLYRVYRCAPTEVWAGAKILYWRGTLDTFCIECGKESTFESTSAAVPAKFVKSTFDHAQSQSLEPLELPELPSGFHTREMVCTRYKWHKHTYFLYITNEIESFETDGTGTFTIQKVGQNPSFGDINIAKTKDYSKVLGKDLHREFSRGIGLASHDVGIGAYVYLRRVFESLVEEAHISAASEQAWDEGTYKSSRMSERVALLKDHLPRFLTEHPEMYALLSKGIHEMTEDECLRNFEALKIGIELILDERLESKRRQEKIAAASKAIKSAHSEAGGGRA